MRCLLKTKELSIAGYYENWVDDNSIFMSNEIMKELAINAGDILALEKGLPLIAKNFPESIINIANNNLVIVSERNFKNLQKSDYLKEKVSYSMMIGCDPEFILVSKDNNIIDASSIFPAYGKLGSDGILGEIRPEPSSNVNVLINNMKNLIRQIKNKTEHFPIGMSSYKGYVSGFHIHFQFPEEIIKYCMKNSAEVMKDIVQVLDYYIGIPAMLFDESDARRLGQSCYGKPGDFRVSNFTMEYRVPGGIFLRHPRYVARLLSTAHCVMKNILGKLLVKTNGWSLGIEDSNFVSHFYKTPDKNVVRNALLSPDRGPASLLLNTCKYGFLSKMYIEKEEEECISEFLNVSKMECSEILTDNW